MSRELASCQLWDRHWRVVLNEEIPLVAHPAKIIEVREMFRPPSGHTRAQFPPTDQYWKVVFSCDPDPASRLGLARKIAAGDPPGAKPYNNWYYQACDRIQEFTQLPPVLACWAEVWAPPALSSETWEKFEPQRGLFTLWRMSRGGRDLLNEPWRPKQTLMQVMGSVPFDRDRRLTKRRVVTTEAFGEAHLLMFAPAEPTRERDPA